MTQGEESLCFHYIRMSLLCRLERDLLREVHHVALPCFSRSGQTKQTLMFLVARVGEVRGVQIAASCPDPTKSDALDL